MRTEAEPVPKAFFPSCFVVCKQWATSSNWQRLKVLFSCTILQYPHVCHLVRLMGTSVGSFVAVCLLCAQQAVVWLGMTVMNYRNEHMSIVLCRDFSWKMNPEIQSYISACSVYSYRQELRTCLIMCLPDLPKHVCELVVSNTYSNMW
jgi:hypothetical protein